MALKQAAEELGMYLLDNGPRKAGLVTALITACTAFCAGFGCADGCLTEQTALNACLGI